MARRRRTLAALSAALVIGIPAAAAQGAAAATTKPVLSGGTAAADKPAPRSTVFGARILKLGMRGRDVRVMQDYLTRAGIETSVDGSFGPGTAVSVRSWEQRADVRVDGRMTRSDARVLRRSVESASAAAPPPVAAAPPVAQFDAEHPIAKATLLPDGTALAPPEAPEVVKQIIAAGNEIHDKPYRYGGGHARRIDTGYDCSGSMSYAFQGAGLLDIALDSTGFMSWGEAGKGQWVTTYANGGHSYMYVAGLRFDTSGRDGNGGSRWQRAARPSSGFTVRHPTGL